MKETQLHIQNVAIDKLIEYSRNPRKNDDAVDKMASCIKEFGFRIPIVAKSDGSVVDGHLRLKAARKLGLKEVPVVNADDLTEAQIKAFRIVVNKSAEWAEWDEELLRLEFKDLEDLDFDLSLTGFDLEDIEKELATLEGNKLEEDDFEENEALQAGGGTITKTGDLWILGNHRLLCGDSTKTEDIEELMNGEKADITFTSPPYNIKASNYSFWDKNQNRRKYLNNDDDLTGEEYTEFLKIIVSICLSFSEFVFVNIASFECNKTSLIDFLFKTKDKYADTMIWDKVLVSPAMTPNLLNSRFEYIHIFNNSGKRKIGTIPFCGTNDNLVCINRGRNKFADIHKAVFPIELPTFFIKNFARNSVLEPFGGTGTTLIAAEQIKKTCFCMEKEPLYCDVIIRRWQELTGLQAVLERTGESFNSLISTEE